MPVTSPQGTDMEKSVHTPEYTLLLRMLRELRQSAGVTQTELAERVGQTQSFISKWERGEVRLDVVQLLAICRVLGTTLTTFVQDYERRLGQMGARRRSGSLRPESRP
jgi:transcriptional regulator with XRE-family HTH domain